jgi:hypothetical protein
MPEGLHFGSDNIAIRGTRICQGLCGGYGEEEFAILVEESDGLHRQLKLHSVVMFTYSLKENCSENIEALM